MGIVFNFTNGYALFGFSGDVVPPEFTATMTELTLTGVLGPIGSITIGGQVINFGDFMGDLLDVNNTLVMRTENATPAEVIRE